MQIHPSIAKVLTPEVGQWAASLLPAELGPSLEFFRRFYHAPLGRRLPIGEVSAAECASGFGLNAIAFVLSGGRSIVGYDIQEGRVAFANALSRRLGLEDRARFELRDVHDLPPREVEVFFTLQTLEHVPRPLDALRGMAERARRALVLSTPNLWWPRDGHDTGLLFAHWAPRDLRKRYAQLRGARTDQLCRFLSPREVARVLRGFHRATRFYNFDSPEEWLDEFPVYFPYGAGGGRWLPARRGRLRWQVASRVHRAAPRLGRDLAPMIEGIYLREGG